MSERIPLLVLGLGNVLLEDDGVGGAAVSLLLDRFDLPQGVQVLDGGTLGLSLLPHLEAADTVILVDAVRADAAPGSLVAWTVRRSRPRSRPGCRRTRSAWPICSTARDGLGGTRIE